MRSSAVMTLPLLCFVLAIAAPASAVRVQSWQNAHCVGEPVFSRPLVDGACNPFHSIPVGGVPSAPPQDPSAPAKPAAMSVKCNPVDNTFLVRFFTDAKFCGDSFNVLVHEVERAGGLGNGECFYGQKPKTSWRVFCNDVDYTLGPEHDTDPAVLQPPTMVPLPHMNIPGVNGQVNPPPARDGL